MPPAALSKQELFTRLAAGHAAGITVVTPNQRLARALRLEFDSFQVKASRVTWDDADILPLSAFLARGYEESLYAEGGDKLPVLLSPAQSQALWEEAIRGSRWHGALLDVPATAARAMEAWKTAQEWRIAGALEKFDGTEDTRAFAEWARTYQRRLQSTGFVDASALSYQSSRIKRPALLVAYAFDVVPAQVEEFFRGFEFSICHPEKKHSRAVKTSLSTPREELEAAARWARARLEEGKARIGVVVPELKLRRREVARVFARTLGSPRPFELSIGEPLADYPIVAFALNLLDFSQRALPFEEASRLLCSPFLGGADAEMAVRARLDAKLRRKAGAEISLPKLIGMLDGESGLRPVLEILFGKARERDGRPWPAHAWAEHFASLLAAAFAGGRATDTREYQARAKFNEVLGDFSRLGLVAPPMPFGGAVGRLRRLCADTRFQPEGEGSPIQVLELLESPGIEFDALWVSGLTDGAWPQHAHPDPFLPVALQRAARIPQSSAEASLALDARRTEGWLGAAEEVVLSWARREEDRELSPSPLIARVPEGAVGLPVYASHRDLIFRSGKTETYADEQSPPVGGRTARGGTAVLSDQSACPFRAWAHHRMQARKLDSPEPGLDALQRGNLVHALMAGIWRELKDSAALSRDVKAVVGKSAAAAVAGLGLEGCFAELERERLVRLATDWLELERGRAPFEVVATEQPRDIAIGGLALKGQIDRMDRLQDGSHALIDYKTGAQLSPRRWMGDRPEEPQLPLYAVSAGEDVSAVAFGRFRVGKMRFMGYAREKEALPQLTHYPTWDALRAGWKDSLEKLAAGYAAGDARVDPKKGLATCRNCDLQPLCRVHEKLGALEEEEGEE